MTIRSSARVASLRDAQFAPRFDYGEMAGVAEVSGAGCGSRLGTGFVRLSAAEIPWTLQYDEVVLVLEGRLTVRMNTGRLTAGPMECIWLPKGTDLTYVADHALIFYAIEPADRATRTGEEA